MWYYITRLLQEREERELTPIQHLLCAKHNVRYFKYILKDWSIRQFISFKIICYLTYEDNEPYRSEVMNPGSHGKPTNKSRSHIQIYLTLWLHNTVTEMASLKCQECKLPVTVLQLCILIFFFFFFFSGTVVWTQSFALAKQGLTTWATPPGPICSGYFGDEFLWTISQSGLKPQLSWSQSLH
jgi:hypothetical protein